MTSTEDGPGDGFTLHLDNFEGPFDLLLRLIAQHELDITEVALSRVTDEFLAHVKAAGASWDLEKTSHFLVVAATLLDLKAARLIPDGEVEGDEDLALLEARDLLFARLLQYRAFKEVAHWLAGVLAAERGRYARPGGLEPQFADLLPEVQLRITPAQLAALAAGALAPKPAAQVSTTHVHAPRASVREQAEILIARLRARRTLSFPALVADSTDRITTVCRFLALLDLFREQAVTFAQEAPLHDLFVSWTGTESGDVDLTTDFDGPERAGTGVDDPVPADQDKEAVGG